MSVLLAFRPVVCSEKVEEPKKALSVAYCTYAVCDLSSRYYDTMDNGLHQVK